MRLSRVAWPQYHCDALLVLPRMKRFFSDANESLFPVNLAQVLQIGVLRSNIPSCGPTAHRFVWRVFLPPPHHPPESRRGPTLLAPASVGSGPHGTPGTSLGRAGRKGQRGRAWRVFPPVCGVRCPIDGAGSLMQAGEGGWRTSIQAARTAIPTATNRSDALSVRDDETEAMRCRSNRNDALSVRR